MDKRRIRKVVILGLKLKIKVSAFAERNISHPDGNSRKAR
jgi:hypothetical protein